MIERERQVRFADPKNDVAFQKIFGDEHHTEILISFLNAILGFEGQKEIEEIWLMNPFIGPDVMGLKRSTLDVKARNRKGVIFIVEMQVEKQDYFIKRSVYYSAKAYSSQISVGEDYPKLQQVIFIGILNFRFFENKEYLSRHLIINTNTMKQSINELEFNYIELPKFNKTIDELDNVVDKWIYFIKNAENLYMIPENITEKPLQEAYKVADMFMWKTWEKDKYESLLMMQTAAKDARNVKMREAKQKGIEQGIKQGMEQGIEQGIEQGMETKERALVINMYKNGMSLKQIASITKLSIEHVKTMVENN